MTYPLVRVVWEDSYLASYEPWVRIADIEFVGDHLIETVGVELTDLDPGHLVIAQSYDKVSESVGPVLVIPEGMVRSRTVLEEASE